MVDNMKAFHKLSIIMVVLIVASLVYNYHAGLNRVIVLDERTRVVNINGLKTLVHEGFVVISKYPPEDPWDSQILRVVINRGTMIHYLNFRAEGTNAAVLSNGVLVEYDRTTNVLMWVSYWATFRVDRDNPSIRLSYYSSTVAYPFLTTGTLWYLRVNEIYTYYANISWYQYTSDVFELYLHPLNTNGNNAIDAISNDVVCNGTSTPTATNNVRYNNTHIMISINFVIPSHLRNTAPIVCYWPNYFNRNAFYMVIKQSMNIDQVAFNVYYIAPAEPSYSP